MEINNNITAYLKDSDFLRYVFEERPSQMKYWREFVARRPEEKDSILRAKYILQHLSEMECQFSAEEIRSLRNRIKESISGQNR